MCTSQYKYIPMLDKYSNLGYFLMNEYKTSFRFPLTSKIETRWQVLFNLFCLLPNRNIIIIRILKQYSNLNK